MAEAQKQQVPYQPPLFTVTARGELIRPVAEIPDLTAASSLEIARWWYRRHLEQERRPINTITSYMYDLALLQDFIGPKPVERITPADVRRFLDLAQNKSTRKRRLTSIGGLFRYLIKDEKILTEDPSDKFFPDFIQLKTPQVLFPDEQDRLLDAAKAENLRTYLIVRLLLKLGLTRAELLALKVDHIDMSDADHPLVYIFYEDVRWQPKERKLAATAEFGEAFRRFVLEYKPERRLFEMMPQSVNKLVDRVAADAGITKRVTPQSLRDTFAVEQAKNGATETKLLQILGLAPDSRNRRSVQRYTKLAQPPVAGVE
ncbi:MAG TPA: tyrosine-type recombinase/integrase [Chloroflexia bacterium]|jgi:integrase/recombinase XerD|nr:tyrosine-type recombinase/integrase [Chloroflexia bacterium]